PLLELVVPDLDTAGRDSGFGSGRLDLEAHEELLAGPEALDTLSACILEYDLSVLAFVEVQPGRDVEAAGDVEVLGDGRRQPDIGRVLGAGVAQADQEDGLAAYVEDSLLLPDLEVDVGHAEDLGEHAVLRLDPGGGGLGGDLVAADVTDLDLKAGLPG